MKGYETLEGARKKIHQLRINSGGIDSLGLDGVSSQACGKLNFLTLKALYRWYGNPARRLVMDEMYNQLKQE